MSAHKIVWYIAGTAAVVAALVLWVRNAGDRAEGLLSGATRVEAMVERLRLDPTMEDPQTRQAVGQVADQTLRGKLDSSEGYFALGLVHAQRQEFEDAEAAYRKAIEIKPEWSWPHNALGIVLGNHSDNRFDEAEAAFRKAVELDPAWSRPHNDLAILLRLAGRFQEAEQEARTALKLDPENVATHNNYGNLLVAQKRLDEAEREYQKAIGLNPNHPKPYYNLACVYALSGKNEESLSLLEKSISLSPALREDARKDIDFDTLCNDPRFIQLTKE